MSSFTTVLLTVIGLGCAGWFFVTMAVVIIVLVIGAIEADEERRKWTPPS